MVSDLGADAGDPRPSLAALATRLWSVSMAPLGTPVAARVLDRRAVLDGRRWDGWVDSTLPQQLPPGDAQARGLAQGGSQHHTLGIGRRAGPDVWPAAWHG